MKVLSGRELLQQIPEHLKDTPFRDLLGETPRQAAVHADDESCHFCRQVLQEIAATGESSLAVDAPQTGPAATQSDVQASPDRRESAIGFEPGDEALRTQTKRGNE